MLSFSEFCSTCKVSSTEQLQATQQMQVPLPYSAVSAASEQDPGKMTLPRLSPRPEGSPRELSKAGFSALDPEDTEEDDPAFQRKRRLAFAKTTIGITMREGGTCKVEESVYGAAIVMPQMARTVGWDRTLTILAIRSWIFLLLNVLLQSYLLGMLAKEENVMDLFAGQMYLCDFGAWAHDVAGPGGTGPGGTEVTAPRMYSWGAWVNRNFVKSSFQALFPEKADEIDHLIDPGEYGVESYLCRWVCCFIFMIPCMQELNIIIKMAELIYQVPTSAEPWIEPKPDSNIEMGLISEVQLKIAGMPLMWKVINLVIVVGLKLLLWKQTAETGMTFLMETSGIQDIIVNSVGLTFIVSLDELICTALMSEETRNFVNACEDFALYDAKTSCVGDMSRLTDDEILQKHNEQQNRWSWSFKDLFSLLPSKLMLSLALTCLFVWQYYLKKCEKSADGRWVSKTMYLPKSVSYTIMQAFFPAVFPPDYESTPYWTMPKEEE